MPTVLLFGPPGSGKGTQADALTEALHVPKIATGDMFRQEVARGSELGRRVEGIMKAGELVPDEVTIAILGRRLEAEDAAAGALLDGFPRTEVQADALDRLLGEMGRRVNLVLYLKVSDQLLVERLSGRLTCPVCGRVYHPLTAPPAQAGLCDADATPLVQRADDSVETARRRIAVYMEQTFPVLDHYRRLGVVSEVDGEGSVEVVRQRVLAAVAGI